MTDRIKHVLKHIGGWTAFLAAVALLLATPTLFLRLTSGSWRGRQAVCTASSGDATRTDAEDVVVHADYWTFQEVAVEGTLWYASAQQTFYLRDGASALPLDTSDCQGIDVFKNRDTHAVVEGTVAQDGGAPLLVVTGMYEMVPLFPQLAFNAGFFGIIIAFGKGVGGVFRLLGFLLVKIGVRKRKHALKPQEADARKAGMLLLAGIFVPLFWIFSPIIGAGYHVAALVAYRNGLRSKKRTVAIIGATLCAAGLVVLTFLSVGFRWYEKGNEGFYFEMMEPWIPPTGREPLEMDPYVNNDAYFSIHPPKGWTEVKEDDAVGFLLRGPQDGTFQEKPFFPEIIFASVSLASLRATSSVPFVQELKKLTAENAGYALVANGRQTFAGGRFDADVLEFTDTDSGYDRHARTLFIERFGILYVVLSEMPSDRWARYAATVEDALRTLEVWEGTFADCLNRTGAVFYGAHDCEVCQEQKKLFTEGIERLPYVECNSFDGESQLSACSSKGIDGYPTWEFVNGERLVGLVPLTALSKQTGCELPK